MIKNRRKQSKKFHKAVHTQEVTGSSPVVSVEKFLIYVKSGTFLLFVSKNMLKLLASSPTNTAIVSDRAGQCRAGNPARCCRNGYSLFVWPEKIRPSISHASASSLASFLIGKSGAVCIMSTKCPQSTCRFRRALFSSVEPSSK